MLSIAEETYELAEDFFFRTVHLGTECWALIAHNRLRCAAKFAATGHWHYASARLCQVRMAGLGVLNVHRMPAMCHRTSTCRALRFPLMAYTSSGQFTPQLFM